MSIYIDRKYIMSLSGRLTQFKQVNSNLFRFRCPKCGDSKKNKYKSRGYIFLNKNEYFFKCFNCNDSNILSKFIEELDYSLYKKYKLEKFQEQFQPQKKEIEIVSYSGKRPEFKKLQKLDIPSIKELDDDHKAKQYILNRKIPIKYHSEIYYAENFKEYVLSILPEYDRSLYEEPRIIIPFYNFSGTLIAFQGRIIHNTGLRYITIKVDETEEKIYGLNRINLNKDIYVTEGPLDSLFINNCIATADSNLSKASQVIDKNKLILIPDADRRNKEIIDNVKTFIDSGFRVCLMPEKFKAKDLNEFVINGGTIEQLSEIIKENVYCGLRAKIEFNNWKKI